MPITLTNFAHAFVANVNLIAKENDPQLKVTPTGFLKMLLQNNATTQINNLPALLEGQEKKVKLRYMPRGLESSVTDVDNCETPISATWRTHEITRPLYSQIGIFISMADMRKYEEEAIQSIATGNPSTPMMRGLYETLLSQLPALIGKIDKNLVAAQATAFGANHAYAGNPTTAQTIEFGESASMNNGYVKLQEDAIMNEVVGNLLLCGSGLITRYDIFNRYKTGVDGKGFGALPVNAYYDPYTVAWGQNHFGAFAKGCIGFVDWNRYVGAYAGEHGGSVFFTLPIPVDLDGELSTIKLDCQLKFIDCPETNSEGEVTQERGWKLIVSKHYGLFTLPTNPETNGIYQTGDVLAGVNGTFHYVATEASKAVEVKPASGSDFNTTVTPADGAVFNTHEVTEEPSAFNAGGENPGGENPGDENPGDGQGE